MKFDVTEYTDQEIQYFIVKHMAALMSVALPLAHIQEDTLPPKPEGLSKEQEFLWRTHQLAIHPDADMFSRTQLMGMLVEMKQNRSTILNKEEK